MLLSTVLLVFSLVSNHYLVPHANKRRIEFEKFKQNDSNEGGDPLGYEAIQRAIRRMSYDYQQKEEEL